MNTLQKSRLCLASGFGLVAALLCGCPVKASCPNCEFLTASFNVTPAQVAGMTNATMTTHVEIPSSECSGSECNVTRTDNVTCKLQKVVTEETREQRLPVASTRNSTHQVTIQIQTAAGPGPTLTGTVGDPSDERGPTLPLCR